MPTGAARASRPLLQEGARCSRRGISFCDFCARLLTGVQQHEEWALIGAPLCANLYCAVLIEPAGSTAFATPSCNREHSRHLPY